MRAGPQPTEEAGVDQLVVWTGWRAPKDDSEAAAALARSAPGATSYQLLAVTGRGFRPPPLLTAADLGAEDDPELPDTPGLPVDWSLVYRIVAEIGNGTAEPYAVYLLGVDPPELGVDPPEGAGDNDLAAFNRFYTEVHLPEVAERRRALRARRYELVRVVRAPYRRAPRFLAAYDVDEQSAAERRHRGPPYTPGPDVWQHHTTPWRLWYRRLG